MQGIFQCRTCNTSLPSSAAWRDHAKSEEHVKHLKARVASSGVVLPSALDHEDEWTKRLSRHPQADHDSEDSLSDTDSEDVSTPDVTFLPGQCLFCDIMSTNLPQNLNHMSLSHSFTIPQQESLIVDVETLLWYLHLLIYGYRECILCSKSRRSVQAIQQHMTAKGHCRFDIANDLKDFYEMAQQLQAPSSPDDLTKKLPSGKVVSHRNQQPESNSSALVRHDSSARLELSTPALSTRSEHSLALMRTGDQLALAHLPTWEVRSVLASRRKQLDSAQRTERRERSRLEARGNKTLMKHFKPDVPGRLNG